jgi:hypothetical protein
VNWLIWKFMWCEGILTEGWKLAIQKIWLHC